MANIKDHQSTKAVKMLLLGDSGTGKTTALTTLANAGYNVRVIDFDNGLDGVRHFLTDEGAKRFHYQTFRDSPVGKAEAFQKANKAILHGWKDGAEDFGKVSDWTDQDVLVIDSLTLMGDAAMRAALTFNGHKVTDQPSQAEWGMAVRDVEWTITYLTSDDVKCNVIFLTHFTPIEDGSGVAKMYPTAVGSKLPTKVARYFNTVVQMDVKPGKDAQRFIRTTTSHKIGLKVAAPPGLLPPEIDPDLNILFKAIKEGKV